MEAQSSEMPMKVTLTYDVGEDGKPLSPPMRVELDVAHDLAGAFARAVTVNPTDSTLISFTSLLTGMVSGSDENSKWLRKELEGQGVTPEKIAGRRTRTYNEAALSTLNLSSLPRQLSTSISARKAIEKALVIMAELNTAKVLDLRHVAAAYPILPNWHEDDFKGLGIDRLAWCRALGAHMAQSFPNEKWYWRKYADRASPVPLTSFSADIYTEKDLLEIDRSVDALALLIGSAKTDTPLSIGIFGEWGSGKSFFMRHLRKRIWTLAALQDEKIAAWTAKREQGTAIASDEPPYYARIAQVEFNAWHYNEGNVFASLVDHLFRNLRVGPAATDEELNEQRAVVLAKIAGAQVELNKAASKVDDTKKQVQDARAHVESVTAQTQAARANVDVLVQNVEDTRSQAENARLGLDVAVEKLTTEAKTLDANAFLAVALSPVTDSEVFRQAKETAETFGSALTDWRAFASKLISPRGVVVIALCLVAPAAVWLGGLLDTMSVAVTGVVTTGTASMASVISYIRDRRKQFEEKLKELEAEETRRLEDRRSLLEKKRKEVQTSWDEKLSALRNTLDAQRKALSERENVAAAALQRLAERTKELDAKVNERILAEKALIDLEAQLKQLSSALLLDEFITSRSGTEEYQKQLGFLALVRRDFERLSDLIVAANEEWRAPDKRTPPPPINRIVLYIDDLDRCKVETVIHVLEAVHLLLAFPLFVCVVAVNPRWIEDCLKQKRADLFARQKDQADETERPLTVGDYLEKIFQIPIWMSPIESRQRADVVKSLLGATAAPLKASTAPLQANEEAAPLRQSGGSRSLMNARATDGFQPIIDDAQKNRDPLRITPEEAQFVDRVAPLLSDKPRALKRFVNTYRLLKASLPDIDRETFVSDSPSSPHKICISQLAFFTGQPRLAPTLVSLLSTPQPASTTLATWIEAQDVTKRRRLEPALRLFPDNNLMSLETFRSWLPDTSKYLFHREHEEGDGLKGDESDAKAGNAASSEIRL